MTGPVYTQEILRLAASVPAPRCLGRVDGAVEERSRTCGSRIRLEVHLSAEGTIEDLSQEVHACAFGQAAAALLAREARGKRLADVENALGSLDAWLRGKSDDPGPWPGLDALSPAQTRKARHGAILMPFQALVAAMKASGR